MIIRKPCPWCGEKISASNVGNRPKRASGKWYELTRNIQVCPYCAGGIKISGKARYGFLAFVPLILTPIIKSFIGADFAYSEVVQTVLFAIAVLGILISLTLTHWEKASDL